MGIAKANVSDTAEITALVNSAYRGESSKQGWTSEAHLLSGQRIDDLMVLNYLQDDHITILKYTDDDEKIIGCVYLEIKDPKLYLGMLTVSPTVQNKGTGKKLVAAAVKFAAEKGSDGITITVISTRAELIAWYERLGFKATGEIRPFTVSKRFGTALAPIELMVMEKAV